MALASFSAINSFVTFEFLLLLEPLRSIEVGLQVVALEPSKHKDRADEDGNVAATDICLRSCHTEVQVLPTSNVLHSEHAEVILVEPQVDSSRI